MYEEFKHLNSFQPVLQISIGECWACAQNLTLAAEI